MATRELGPILQHVRGLLQQNAGGTTDADLLGRFVRHQDEAAFAALVDRHGPMVWAVCRRLLPNEHDAEDAFQATFLILVRKATSVRPPAMVGNWLHGVAHRTALAARKANARRRAKEAGMVARTPTPAGAAADLREVLDRELARLPAKYRVLLVLCDLEGRTRSEVARLLGLAEGTVASRLARGRALLGKRLLRHGLTPAVLSPVAWAGVPAPLVRAVVGVATSGTASTRVTALAEGVLRAMLLTKLKTVTVPVVLAGVLAAAAVFAGTTGGAGEPEAPGPGRTPQGTDAQAKVAEVASRPARVQVRLASPAGMRVWVQNPAGRFEDPVEVPGRLNLEAGPTYRLKLADIPNHPGLARYPTLAVAKPDAATEVFLQNSAVPVELAEADFEHAATGKVVTKVVYLASAKDRDKAATPPGKAAALASYDLPGRDVVQEAKQRGAVLVVLRLGDIDLEGGGAPTPAGRRDQGASAGPQRGSGGAAEGVVKEVAREDLVRVTLRRGSVRPGDVLHLFRTEPEPAYLGRLSILQVEGGQAVGRVVHRVGPIKAGDRVAGELPASGGGKPKQ